MGKLRCPDQCFYFCLITVLQIYDDTKQSQEISYPWASPPLPKILILILALQLKTHNESSLREKLTSFI